jgi:hypothetical protein
VSLYFQVLTTSLRSLSFNLQARLIKLKQDNPELSQTIVAIQVIKVKQSH